ncbi:hypothetical protein F4805DRAFT_348384 [Annulohypoxylon moriforme]|nr:hypothetical protein F4805DRAFT_348384 [Annulohypoxylon moriforme]
MSWTDQSVSSGSASSGDTAYTSYTMYTAPTGYPTSTSYAASTGSNLTTATEYTHYSQDQENHYNMYEPPPTGTYLLPCEFVGLGSCDVQFQFEDTETWIEHIITSHLQDKLPQKAVCWFCNEYSFDCKDPRVPRSDRRLNFHNRMEHIRGHIADGKTALDMVPDFHMLDHLLKHRLISEIRYNEVRKAYHGLPFPREHLRGIFRPNFVPPERQKQAERSNMVQIDHAKEERQRKKDRKRR